jgi:hypothetical protein
MNTPPEDYELLRWLDGEMNDAERAAFEARLAADPALQGEAALMKRLSSDLRSHLPAEMPVPYADFFNSQIQVRLAQDENSQPAPDVSGGWLRWLRLPWLTTAFATAALVLAGLVAWQNSTTAGNDELVHSIYVPKAGVEARSFHSKDARATVLVLDGLEEMPADRKIVGFNISHGEVDEALAATTLFDDQGRAVAVISKDARNQPLLLTTTNPRG